MKILNRLRTHHQTVSNVFPGAISYGTTQNVHGVRFAFLQETDRLRRANLWLRTRTARQWMLATSAMSGFVLIAAVGLTVMFLSPQNHTYSFSKDNCFFNPVALPNTMKHVSGESFKASIEPSISVGSTPLFSTTTCVEIMKIPNEQINDTVLLKSPFTLSKNIELSTQSLPTITPYESLKNPVSPDAVLLFSVDQLDNTFGYILTIGDASEACVLHTTLLGCPTESFKLDQGTEYNYSVSRVLNNESSQVLSDTIVTLDPVTITSSSMKPNELIYDIPKSISITTSKPISRLSQATLESDDTKTIIPLTLETSETTVTYTFSGDLPRNTSFVFTIENITSTDGSYLAQPYVLNFKTSDGPRVQGVNIGNYRVSPSSAITITFDVGLDASQPIADYVSLVGESGAIASTISIQNNSLTIRPTSSLGACNAFTVAIKDGIKNQFGVSGSSAWSKQSRTICQQVFSIGTSVQGRSITAYRFGTGATKILVVGGMHGDEKSSVRTLTSFVDDLEQNYTSIPADKTVIVIPNSNPDGFNASTRTNANGVDLNRNFPTFDWASGVYMPRNVFLEMGGGATPLSEPESSVLASYTRNLSPRVVLTFHATGRAVFANDAGDSKTIADLYAEKSGFTSYSDADASSFFSYPTTGEYEDWIRDKLNLPALLVELASVGNNEFARQKPALWAMLSL